MNRIPSSKIIIYLLKKAYKIEIRIVKMVIVMMNLIPENDLFGHILFIIKT